MQSVGPDLFILGFVGLWIGVSILLARIGGWSTLADVYRSSEAFEGNRWRFQSAQMRWGVNYNGILTVGANTRGLYLAVGLLLRAGHPPLFIPWTDISVRPERGRWFAAMEFRCRRAPAIPIRISEGLGRRIVAAAGHWWPGEKPS